MTVPVEIEICESAPIDDFSEWDKINECSLDIPSGKIVIAGCTDYLPDAKRITVSPGMYRARIYYGNLEPLSEDGLDGDDHYKIALWQSGNKTVRVIKGNKGD